MLPGIVSAPGDMTIHELETRFEGSPLAVPDTVQKPVPGPIFIKVGERHD